jgi:hypothetical protein
MKAAICIAALLRMLRRFADVTRHEVCSVPRTTCLLKTEQTTTSLIYLTDTPHNHNIAPYLKVRVFSVFLLYLLSPNLSVIPESHQEALSSPTE